MTEEMVRIKHLENPNITTFVNGKQITIRNHEALVSLDDAKAMMSGPYGYELIGIYDDFIKYVNAIHTTSETFGNGAPSSCVLVGTPLAGSKLYAWQQFTEALLNLEGREELYLLFTIDDPNAEWTDTVRNWAKQNVDKFYNISIITWDFDKEKAWNRVFKITVGRQMIFNFARMVSDITDIWFIDSDNIVPINAYKNLSRVNSEARAGLYRFKAVISGGPVVFECLGKKNWPPTCLGKQVADAKPETGIIECDWTGAGCLMLSRKIFEKYNFDWSKWIQRNGEDAWICLCAQKETGKRLLVDTSVDCGHLDDKGTLW